MRRVLQKLARARSRIGKTMRRAKTRIVRGRYTPEEYPEERPFDMRHDKYLNAHRRAMRRLAWSISHPGGKPEPAEWTRPAALKPQPIKRQPKRRPASSYRGHKNYRPWRRPPEVKLRHIHATAHKPHQGKRECARRRAKSAEAAE